MVPLSAHAFDIPPKSGTGKDYLVWCRAHEKACADALALEAPSYSRFSKRGGPGIVPVCITEKTDRKELVKKTIEAFENNDDVQAISPPGKAVYAAFEKAYPCNE